MCVTDTANPKPHPDPLLTYLDKRHVMRQSVLYIGDSIYDARCAYAAGVDFGLAQWGGHPDLEDMVPKFIFRTPNEILGVV